MRFFIKFLFFLVLVGGGGWGYKIYRVQLDKAYPVTWKTVHPMRRDIVCKKIFSGNLVPAKEICLEADSKGILDKLFVQVGDQVEKGASIARIKIQPHVKEVSMAESKLRLAAIELKKVRGNYLRHKQLFNKKMLSKETYEAVLALWEEAKEKFVSAQDALQIIKSGHDKSKGRDALVIRAPAKGTVLSLPFKEGSSIQTFSGSNNATYIAILADMDRLLFTAQVSELDVVHLTPGMRFKISLNALKDKKLPVKLTRIAPKANEKAAQQGEVRFDIEGIIEQPKHMKIALRAGYIGLAELIINQAKNVLTIPEKMIRMQGEHYFVSCLEDGQKVDKMVVLGLSDHFYVEVKEGLTEADELIMPE